MTADSDFVSDFTKDGKLRALEHDGYAYHADGTPFLDDTGKIMTVEEFRETQIPTFGEQYVQIEHVDDPQLLKIPEELQGLSEPLDGGASKSATVELSPSDGDTYDTLDRTVGNRGSTTDGDTYDTLDRTVGNRGSTTDGDTYDTLDRTTMDNPPADGDTYDTLDRTVGNRGATADSDQNVYSTLDRSDEHVYDRLDRTVGDRGATADGDQNVYGTLDRTTMDSPPADGDQNVYSTLDRTTMDSADTGTTRLYDEVPAEEPETFNLQSQETTPPPSDQSDALVSRRDAWHNVDNEWGKTVIEGDEGEEEVFQLVVREAELDGNKVYQTTSGDYISAQDGSEGLNVVERTDPRFANLDNPPPPAPPPPPIPEGAATTQLGEQIRIENTMDVFYNSQGEPDGILAITIGDQVLLPSGQKFPLDQAEAVVMNYETDFQQLLFGGDFDSQNTLLLNVDDAGGYHLRSSGIEVSKEFIENYKQLSGGAVEIIGSSGEDLSGTVGALDDTVDTAAVTGRIEADAATQGTAEGRVIGDEYDEVRFESGDTQPSSGTAEETTSAAGGGAEGRTAEVAEAGEQPAASSQPQATTETAEQTGRVETDTQATTETAEQTGRVETDTQATTETAEQTGRVETDTQATAETAEQTGRVETDTQATAETAEQTGRVETDTQATTETAEQTGRVETDTQTTAETAEQTGRVETDTQGTAENGRANRKSRDRCVVSTDVRNRSGRKDGGSRRSRRATYGVIDRRRDYGRSGGRR